VDRHVIRHLLPKGYPGAVAPSYANYAVWTALGSAASSAAGVLSMQALLHAVGAGMGAVPLAAALQWVIKDGLGQLGGVLFVSFVNTRFDSDAKRWRMASALALEASTLLEVLTPAFPALFLPLAAVANAGKNISMLSASATRAGIHQSLSTAGNLADVTAKAGSQTVAASLAGTSLGIAMSPLVGSATPAVLAAWSVLALVHIGTLHRALHLLALPTLNPWRAEAAARAHWAGAPLPSPEDLRASESVLGPALWRGQQAQSDVPLDFNPLLDTPHGAGAPAAVERAVARWTELSGGVERALALMQVAPVDARAPVAEAAAGGAGEPSFAFALWLCEGDGTVCVGIEAGAPWWAPLAGHLAATKLQLAVEAGEGGVDGTAEAAAEAALRELPAYTRELERLGWWLGHPMVEEDATLRLRLEA